MLSQGHIIIGTIFHSMEDDATQSAVYYTAGIRDGAIGAFRYHLGFDQAPDDVSQYEFIPYDECPPVVQAGLAGQIDGLINQLMGDLGVPAA
ncbi:MAG TPA: hypothetical protein VH092_01095 [Urbifossiella sp.]|nr:hypothetical protein [Urbifossiella sp.]